MDTSLTTVYSPLSMSITVLPRAIKNKVRATYEKFIATHVGQLSEFQMAGLLNILSYMDTADHTPLGREFKKLNEVLDKQWNRSFSATFPPLADWYAGL